MNFISECLSSPLFAVFAVLFLGHAAGKIKIRGTALGSGAVLLVAVFAGAAAEKSGIFFGGDFDACVKFLSSAGSALFISVTGIKAGGALAGDCKRNRFSAFFAGAASAISAFFAMLAVSFIDRQFDVGFTAGIFCGALTSSPALSAAVSLTKNGAEMLVAGYGSSYLTGLFMTVLFVSNRAKKFGTLKKTPSGKRTEEFKNLPDILLRVFAAAALGLIIGKIKFPGTEFSLGSNGGILLSGIFVGLLTEKLSKNKKLPENEASFLQKFGLELFFAGQGISCGKSAVSAFGIRPFLYGLLFSAAAILTLYVFCRIFFRKEPDKCVSALAGGMTSTPALGNLSDRNFPVDYAVYSTAYFGALIVSSAAMIIYFSLSQP